MSILPTSGIIVSAAGVPLAQTGGPECARAQQAATAQQRHDESEIRAEDTAGIAATDGEDQETNDRDADGRRPWEFPHRHEAATDASIDPNANTAASAQQPVDLQPEAEDHIDLTG